MEIRCILIFYSFFFLLSASLAAQNPPHRPGEYLISMEDGADVRAMATRLDPASRTEPLTKMLNIWLLRSDLPEAETLAWLRRQPELRCAQFNHMLENRNVPNDLLFPEQWQWLNNGMNGGVFDADLDAEQAWDLATGGLTPAGDSIVMAVIDGGLDAAHPDLAPNLWHNRAEFPNNGLDDDGNGYTDDFRGWNVFAESDAIEGNSTAHGTPVSAILGAKGNNEIGVSGVNWDTQILFVAASGSEAAILKAYDYVLQTRQRYNASQGDQGAFVVSVNCSWGINYGQPSEAPLWCAAFDALGAAGIVSVAATANLAVNVDEVGDLPTACPSNYLIGVTSLNSSDKKAETAAWGKKNVDLGAYGQEVYTAAAANGYGYFSGTSYAAPQVTGAIGLLYSAPCPSLIALAKTNPASAAYWVKSLILENITPNPSLDGKTATDGRLNLYRVIQTYENQCSTCPSPFALKTETLTDTAVVLRWTRPPSAIAVHLRWRLLGQGLWNTLNPESDTFFLDHLAVCTLYEFEAQSVCDGLASAWSQPIIFQTKGCCTPPGTIWLENSSPANTKINWEASSFNNTYRLRLRQPPNGPWSYFEVEGNSWTFENLAPCMEYQAQVQARCEDWLTPYSSLFVFHTKGCGACNEIEYCVVPGQLATEEWIAKVKIGNWDHYSGPGGNGYQNFGPDQSNYPELIAKQPRTVEITPGFSGASSKEYYRIFIDFNQDGDFEDADELAFDPGFALEGVAQGMIQAPANVTPGITRLRVMMKFTTPNDNPPMACTPFEFGQVEDYCVELLPDSVSTGFPAINFSQPLRVYPQPAGEWAVLEFPELRHEIPFELLVLDMTARTVSQQQTRLPESGKLYLDTQFWASGLYLVQARLGNQVFYGKILKG